jgi:hypothetical protein
MIKLTTLDVYFSRMIKTEINSVARTYVQQVKRFSMALNDTATSVEQINDTIALLPFYSK